MISDFQPGSLGAGLLTASILTNLPPGWDVLQSSVYNFDTLSAGYLVGQCALQHENLRPQHLVIFASVSPRTESRQKESFVHARLRNGIVILALNAGHILSFVRGSIDEFRKVKVESEGAFQPFDLFPTLVGPAAGRKLEESLGEELDAFKEIPEAPHGVICYIDNFGNIKTTYREHDDVIKHVKSQGAGTRIRIEINGQVRAAATGPVDLLEGDMVFAPQAGPYLDRFWGISCRRGDAAAIFNNPPPGSAIKLLVQQR